MNFTRPKGTRDFPPTKMRTQVAILKKIENIFTQFSFERWDGPMFENLSTLTYKSGEAVKDEIYTFKDKADRELGLRFELTTTIARIMATNPELKLPIKAYNFGKVFRYENTQAGRYREFMQMDADIFGCDGIGAELELLSLINKVLTTLGFDSFRVVISDRAVIKAMLNSCGIEEKKHVEVCRSIDKLAKIGFDGVKAELNEIISQNQIDKVIKLLEIDGDNEIKLEKMSSFLQQNGQDNAILENLKNILSKVESIQLPLDLRVDFTLMRGLGYYTGTIFEMRIDNEFGIGSVGGGGRYDKLIESFGGQKMAACGMSFGIERIFDIIEKNEELKNKLSNGTNRIYIANVDENSCEYCEKLALKLRNEGLIVEFNIANKKYQKQLNYALENSFDYLISIGEEEMQTNYVSIKNLKTREQSKINQSDLSSYLK